MYGNGRENIDREKQFAEQLDKINNVTNWLKEEDLTPQEITYL